MTHLPAAEDISLVNLAARQRMLSQRLALQIVLAAQGREGMSTAAQTTLSLFADSQARLLTTVQRLPATDAAAVQAVAREAKVVSFNAQVIAARAGAVGREFAVVASTPVHHQHRGGHPGTQRHGAGHTLKPGRGVQGIAH